MPTMSNATPPTAADLIGHVRRAGEAVVIAVHGEVDLHNSPALRTEVLRHLEDPTVHRLILNLAGVPYMDTSAVAVLVEAWQRLRKVGGKLCLTDVQQRVRDLLEIARLDRIFAFCPDEATALK
jgi:anti-sigma B factor antagonist